MNNYGPSGMGPQGMPGGMQGYGHVNPMNRMPRMQHPNMNSTMHHQMRNQYMMQQQQHMQMQHVRMQQQQHHMSNQNMNSGQMGGYGQMRQNNFQTPMMQNQQMMGGMGQQRNQQQGGMNSYQNY